jgi:branched-chain amino acid transport system ATP-binding protein
MGEALLQVEGLEAGYDGVQVLWGISLDVAAGDMTTLVGANGAGKTTTLRAVTGSIKPFAGRVLFRGEDVTHLPPHAKAERGLVLVPEGRQLFSEMSVTENLEMGAFSKRARSRVAERQTQVYTLFPRLAERRRQKAGTLSGGEQQMLAIARALMARPRLLLLDEPSLGLAPLIVRQIFDAIRELNRTEKLTVFLVEQNAFHALKLAHRGYVMVNGVITLSGTGKELLDRPEVKAAYLEGGRQEASA